MPASPYHIPKHLPADRHSCLSGLTVWAIFLSQTGRFGWAPDSQTANPFFYILPGLRIWGVYICGAETKSAGGRSWIRKAVAEIMREQKSQGKEQRVMQRSHGKDIRWPLRDTEGEDCQVSWRLFIPGTHVLRISHLYTPRYTLPTTSIQDFYCFCCC